MSNELVIRCNNCQKGHMIRISDPNKTQSFSFICRCGNKVTGNYEADQLIVTGATISERKEGEALYMHEPELKQQ